MRACFVLEELSPSGGVSVILSHARRLAERGAEVELLVARPGGEARVPGPPARPLAEATGRFDVAIGTWWATGPRLLELEATRRVMFLQSLEQRFYAGWELFDRTGAGLVLGLPVDFLVVAGWLRDLLASLRPDARCWVVRNGIDKEIFGARRREPRDGPLRVLVEGNPALAFKGVTEAAAAVRDMAEPAELTLVSLDAAAVEGLGADRVAGALDATGMAELYAEHDVLVKLSRVEGLPLPPLEAFHAGVPCVVTPFTGHEEYVRHGENGLVVGFDDPAAVTGWLDRLARDRALLERLGRGALETADAWPDRDAAGDEFASVAEELLAEDPPAPERAASLLAGQLELVSELGRLRALLAGWDEAALARLRTEAIELRAERDQLAARLDAIESSPAFRAARAARRAVRREQG